MIKLVTGSKYNHAALFFNVWGKQGILEAQTDGINWKPFDAWEEKYNYNYIVYRHHLINEQELAFKAFQKCGVTAYDFESFIIRQPLKIVSGIWKSKGEEEEEDKMICSEFCAWAYGLKEWEKMTPKDLKKALDESPFFKRVNI